MDNIIKVARIANMNVDQYFDVDDFLKRSKQDLLKDSVRHKGFRKFLKVFNGKIRRMPDYINVKKKMQWMN